MRVKFEYDEDTDRLVYVVVDGLGRERGRFEGWEEAFDYIALASVYRAPNEEA